MTNQWEYQLLELKDLSADQVQAKLDQLGVEGWEAFAYVGYHDLDSMVLKRPKTPVAPAYRGGGSN